MNNFRFYSEEEDNILIEELKRTPYNLASGFRRAADRIGRSESAVSQHWYDSLSKKPQAEPVFMAISSNKSCKNRKIIREDSWDSSTNTRRGIWSRILSFFGFNS